MIKLQLRNIKLTVAVFATACHPVFGHNQEARLPFNNAHAHEVLEGHVHVGWESRYLSEGRDSLGGDSLWSGSAEFSLNHLVGGIWYGSSDGERYDELQLTLGLTQELGDFEFYGAYTHLRFPFEDSYDNELGVGFAWAGMPLDLEFATDVYYSFDAEGLFTECSLSRELEISDELSLEISAILGVNNGYVSDGHDGMNHFALSLGAQYALTESLSLTAHAVYSWAVDRDSSLEGDDQLVDFFHSGVGLQWSF